MKWRPIKTAPKDQHILLRYGSFSNNGEIFVNQGRWVDTLHSNHLETLLREGGRTPKMPHDGHWEIAYVATFEHGGRWSGNTWQERSCRVEPTHWMPMPKVPKR